MGLQEGECRPWQTGWRQGQEWSHGQQGALSVPHRLLSPAELLASLHRPALPHSVQRSPVKLNISQTAQGEYWFYSH